MVRRIFKGFPAREQLEGRIEEFLTAVAEGRWSTALVLCPIRGLTVRGDEAAEALVSRMAMDLATLRHARVESISVTRPVEGSTEHACRVSATVLALGKVWKAQYSLGAVDVYEDGQRKDRWTLFFEVLGDLTAG